MFHFFYIFVRNLLRIFFLGFRQRSTGGAAVLKGLVRLRQSVSELDISLQNYSGGTL
jgi:hypothetical protein